MEWHDISCPRLDLISSGDLETCLRCGSFGRPATTRLFPPLSKQSDTRLLHLLPGDFLQDIHCEIYVHDLASRPEYEAISYTWADDTGNDDLSETVFIFGKAFSVTRNCKNALKRIRRSDDVRVVWIDAICIDQNDTNERGHQVQLMPRIYSSAERVLIYIGERTADSDFCFDALDSGRMHGYDAYESQKFITSLKCLLSRQYFSRAWVLQEIALARTATVICGDRVMLWWRLCDANLEDGYYGLEIQRLINTSLLKMKEAELYTTPDRLLDLLDISRRCHARDPRDKVYALLGLIIDHRRLDLAADYNLTVKELYIKVALRLAQRHGWASVLFRAGTRNRAIDALPSWVPDWSYHFDEQPSPYEIHKLDYGPIQFNDKDNSLQFKAFAIGLRDDLKLFPFKAIPTNISDQAMRDSLSIWHYLFIDSGLNSLMKVDVKVDVEFQEDDFYLQVPEGEIIGNRSTTVMHDTASLWCPHYLVNAHKIAESFELIDAYDLFKILKVLAGAPSLRTIGGPWANLLRHFESSEYSKYSGFEDWRFEYKLRLAIGHESRPPHEIDSLWRDKLALNPLRQGRLKGAGIEYQLLLDINEAVWKLLVRLCFCRNLEVKMI